MDWIGQGCIYTDKAQDKKIINADYPVSFAQIAIETRPGNSIIIDGKTFVIGDTGILEFYDVDIQVLEIVQDNAEILITYMV